MIEDDHQIVEGEEKVRQAERVRRLVGEVLDVADGVVRRVSDGAAAEARQARQRHRLELGDLFLKRPDGVVRRETLGGVPGADLDLILARAKEPERVTAEEAVPGDLFAAARAFEQEGVVAAGELFVGAHRRQRVRKQGAANRDHVPPLGQVAEALK